MKTGRSSLNANAAVYVPLCARGVAGQNQEHPVTAKVSETRNATGGFGPHSVNTTVDYHPNHHGPYGSSSKSPKEVSQKSFSDENSEMDLAYLQMTFPEFSDESLFHIYMANGGDLETTVDMLNQLEVCTDDSLELPDTLEIGDSSEFSKECASLKLKEVADEITGSSGSPN